MHPGIAQYQRCGRAVLWHLQALDRVRSAVAVHSGSPVYRRRAALIRNALRMYTLLWLVALARELFSRETFIGKDLGGHFDTSQTVRTRSCAVVRRITSALMQLNGPAVSHSSTLWYTQCNAVHWDAPCVFDCESASVSACVHHSIRPSTFRLLFLIAEPLSYFYMENFHLKASVKLILWDGS